MVGAEDRVSWAKSQADTGIFPISRTVLGGGEMTNPPWKGKKRDPKTIKKIRQRAQEQRKEWHDYLRGLKPIYFFEGYLKIDFLNVPHSERKIHLWRRFF